MPKGTQACCGGCALACMASAGNDLGSVATVPGTPADVNVAMCGGGALKFMVFAVAILQGVGTSLDKGGDCKSDENALVIDVSICVGGDLMGDDGGALNPMA